MRHSRRIATGLIVATTAALTAGCSSTGTFGREKLAVQSGTQYVGGRGYAMYATTPDLIENVKATMIDLGMSSIHEVPEPNGGSGLEATTADQRSARLSIHSTGVRSTVALKVGWLGDEPLTRSFLDRLEGRQGALPRSAMAVEPEPEPETPARFAKAAVPDSIMIRNQLDPTFNPSIAP